MQQGTQNLGGQVKGLLDSTTGVVGGSLASLLMGIAFVVFLLAVINFIWKRRSGGSGYGRDNGLQDARNMLGWSVFGLFVMVSVWGIIYFFSSGLGINNVTSAKRPQTCFGDGCGVTTPASTKP